MSSSNDIFKECPCAFFDIILDPDDEFCLDLGEIIEVPLAEFYDGSYIITPLDTDQVLPTEQKGMRDDLTVLAVPYAEVSNLAGGTTVIIGI